MERGLGQELARAWTDRGVQAEPDAAAELLAAILDAGRAAWPELSPDPAALARFVGERTAGPAEVDPARYADWVMASECARGDGRACAIFDERLLPKVTGAIKRLKLGPGELDVALQRVRTDLLVSAPERPAGITRYAGRGDLVAWLRVTAVRAAMKLARGRGREASLDDEQLGDRIAHGADDPELQYMKAVYRPHFRAAFREALAELEPRERTLLKQSLLDGLSVDALAGLHQVHRATAARWLAAARERLVKLTRDGFQAKVQIGARECESIFRRLGSELDITLRRLADDP